MWTWDSEHLLHLVDQLSEPPQQHQAGTVWGQEDSHCVQCDKEWHRTLRVWSPEPSECPPQWPIHPECSLWVISVPTWSRPPGWIYSAGGQAVPIPLRSQCMEPHLWTPRLTMTSCPTQAQADLALSQDWEGMDCSVLRGSACDGRNRLMSQTQDKWKWRGSYFWETVKQDCPWLKRDI